MRLLLVSNHITYNLDNNCFKEYNYNIYDYYSINFVGIEIIQWGIEDPSPSNVFSLLQMYHSHGIGNE